MNVFDRAPLDDLEELIINAFSQVRAVEEIWVRYVKDEELAPIIGDAARRKCRVYLTFGILAEEYFKRVAEIRDGEFAQHVYGRNMDFEFIGIPRGIVPTGAPSRIWQKGIDDEQRGVLT